MPKQTTHRGCQWSIAIILLLPLVGCSSPSVPTPKDPQQMAQAAMEAYDTNSDGKIAGAELDKCHSLKSAMSRFDTNRDGAITVDELVQRFEAYKTQSTFVGVMIQLTKGGAPLADAVVTLTPEPFMGDGFQVFKGTSGANGSVMVEGQDSNTPDVPTGLYQVTIADASGNTIKTTGREVSDDVGNRIDFTL